MRRKIKEVETETTDFSILQSEIGNLKVEAKSVELLIKNSEEKLREMEASTLELNSSLGDLEAESKELSGVLQGLEENKKAVVDKLSELEDKGRTLDEVRNKLEKAKREHDQKNLELEEANEEMAIALEKKKKAVHINELQLERVLAELDNLREKTEEEQHLTVNELLAIVEPLKNKKSCREDIDRLKDEIELMGAINFSALNEHLEVAQRLAFLETQLSDLESARLSLGNVIREMEEIMEVRFKRTFIKISHNFNTVFKEIFGGGEAGLELQDTENALESGIEIFVRTPGKKMQNLNLLSGGERALVAIALLFAMAETKSSPFYILDEIDASLDEQNIQKFVGYMERAAKRAQYIVVSHRRGTMEISDALYGVTLEENVVSRLASVVLSEDALRGAEAK